MVAGNTASAENLTPDAADVSRPAQTAGTAPVFEPQIVATYPHSTADFTQGLLFVGDRLFESTGLYGRSQIAERDLYQRDAFNKKALNRTRFGEGLAQVGDRLVQLTWRAGEAYVYDLDLRLLETWTYTGEGWGLTTIPRGVIDSTGAEQAELGNIGDADDATHDAGSGDVYLIRTDGSNRLYFHEPQHFKVERVVPVFDGDAPITQLNELEFIDGLIYANVWRTRRIAVIEPRTGKVVRWLDLRGLDAASMARGDRSLNGIAWHAEDRKLLVTGKQWGAMYEILDPALAEGSIVD